MSRRRRLQEEQSNHERWLISYADFITLLFAFFVVMYSISSVNEGKYRVLSSTLLNAFKEPVRSGNPVQIGELSQGSGALLVGKHTPLPTAIGPQNIASPEDAALLPTVGDAGPSTKSLASSGTPESTAKQRLRHLTKALEMALERYQDDRSLTIANHGRWIEVSMKSGVLFGSGDARLSTAAVNILRDLSRVLVALPNPVRVEGYTDDVPINTEAFPSNWELSAARAASVVHLFTRLGMDPRRLAAVGYGEHRPIADNSSEEGRRQNRRVTLVIATDIPEDGRVTSDAMGYAE